MKENILIVEFMGFERTERGSIIVESLNLGHKLSSVKRLRFDSSWDWLMPVAKKCLEKVEGFQPVLNMNLKEGLKTVDFDVVYKYVITYIEWYNKQTK